MSTSLSRGIEAIKTQDAPAPIGPYSQAIRAGSFVILSGQTPIDPSTNQVVQGDIEVQTRRAMENLRAVLGAAGLSFADVVKTTIFLRDLDKFALVNRVYGEYFGETPPARSTIQVSRLPRDADIEIEMMAYFAT